MGGNDEIRMQRGLKKGALLHSYHKVREGPLKEGLNTSENFLNTASHKCVKVVG